MNATVETDAEIEAKFSKTITTVKLAILYWHKYPTTPIDELAAEIVEGVLEDIVPGWPK